MRNTTARCAVVFKTYAWDGFVERQAQRLAEAAGGLDFYVSVDETNGHAGPIPFERVIRFTCADLEVDGMAMRSPAGGVLWWNPDYAHYQFQRQFPNYDYYLFLEYDCVVQGSLEEFVDKAVSKGADLVAMPMESKFHEWHWWPYLRNIYLPDEVNRALLCVCFQSSSALKMLYQRRLEMSADPSVVEWPNSELFVSTEVVRAGMSWLPMADFADLSNYGWFPPVLEEDLRPAAGIAFLHPVLDRRRYISSMVNNRGSLKLGELDRALSRFPREEYAHIIRPARRKNRIQMIRHKVRQKLARLQHRMEFVAEQIRHERVRMPSAAPTKQRV